MRLLFVLICGALFGIGPGCGKKSETAVAAHSATAADGGAHSNQVASTPSGSVPPSDAIDARAATAMATSPLPPGTPVKPVMLTDPGNLVSTLADLTQALRKYSFEQKRLPATFQEVISAGYVSPQPTPPAGKKFEIDRKTKQVVLVNQ
jgi:hypothetical protein